MALGSSVSSPSAGYDYSCSLWPGTSPRPPLHLYRTCHSPDASATPFPPPKAPPPQFLIPVAGTISLCQVITVVLLPFFFFFSVTLSSPRFLPQFPCQRLLCLCPLCTSLPGLCNSLGWNSPPSHHYPPHSPSGTGSNFLKPHLHPASLLQNHHSSPFVPSGFLWVTGHMMQ